MERFKLGEMEKRLADMIWENAPIGSGEIVKMCASEFSWKKSTTYTMLGRLCERKIFENKSGMVVALMTPDEFAAGQGEQFLNETFGGSLPQFFAAFTRKNKLSDNEIIELQRMIDSHREG